MVLAPLRCTILPFLLLTFLFLTLPYTAYTLSIPPHLTKPVTKHAWIEIPRGWVEDEVGNAALRSRVMTRRGESDSSITLKIALKQERVDELVKALYDVSEVGGEKYGRYLSKA